MNEIETTQKFIRVPWRKEIDKIRLYSSVDSERIPKRNAVTARRTLRVLIDTITMMMKYATICQSPVGKRKINWL